MKNLLRNLFIILFSLSLFSCEKDDDNDFDSHFMYNGTKYELEYGFYGSEFSDPNYVHYYAFSTDGVNFNTNTDEFTGSGDVMIISIVTSSSTAPSGTHNIWGESGIILGTSFVNGEPSGGDGHNFTAGTITITMNGSTYEIEINGTIDNSQALTGQYKGPMPPFEF